jgi:hypothetical protein
MKEIIQILLMNGLEEIDLKVWQTVKNIDYQSAGHLPIRNANWNK